VRAVDWARLAALALIWSLQYIFMRLAVPVFGTGALAAGRALFAALLLVAVAVILSQRIAPISHWKDHLIVALPNNAFPFVCFAWAASVLPAGYLSIVNGTVPLWTGVLAAWILGERLGARRLAGFILGIAGVALTVNLGPVELTATTLLAALVSLAGAASWAYGGVVIKQRGGKLPPIGLAAGSISVSALILAPLWSLAPPPAAWTLEATSALVAVGSLCSGVAYIAFFTLVRDIGPSRTLSTGLIVPALGVLWGWLFLGEAVTAPMILGVALVLIALVVVMRR
jgi:drug/metabolite transporter (DMT)-like permease